MPVAMTYTYITCTHACSTVFSATLAPVCSVVVWGITSSCTPCEVLAIELSYSLLCYNNKIDVNFIGILHKYITYVHACSVVLNCCIPLVALKKLTKMPVSSIFIMGAEAISGCASLWLIATSRYIAPTINDPLISLWHILESKGDKFSSSAECRIRSWEVSDRGPDKLRLKPMTLSLRQYHRPFAWVCCVFVWGIIALHKGACMVLTNSHCDVKIVDKWSVSIIYAYLPNTHTHSVLLSNKFASDDYVVVWCITTSHTHELVRY